MVNKNSRSRQRLGIDDLKDALISIAEKKKSQDKKLVTVREIQTWLKINKSIKVSGATIRNNGFVHQGYFEKKYPGACSYNYKGNTNYRGLVIKPEKFLEEMSKEGRT